MDSMKSGATQVVTDRTVIIDTGSTNLMIPGYVRFIVEPMVQVLTQQLLPGIYRALNADRKERTQDGSYMIPCTRESGVDDLVFTFGGLDWPMAYQDIV
jgi:hypothetical protein